jgi:hypothetical protein
MIKKVILGVVLFSSLLACKKEEALSKIDPKSQDVQMNVPAESMISNPSAVESTNSLKKQPQETPPPPPPADGKYPAMSFAKKEHNFGVINEGDKVETIFTFTNSGEADLIISNASGSCGCTVPEFPKEPIKPGKSGKMKVTFDSNGKPGKQQKTITITANTETNREVLTINAEVTPKAKTEETKQ